MILSDLLKDVEIKESSGNIGVRVSGVKINSREVKPGDVFVCIAGFQTDGHSYVEDALSRGAVAIVAQHEIEDTAATTVIVEDTRGAVSKMAAAFYDYPFRKFRLIGVTGTNGKTTTTYLIKSILESCGEKVGLIGTNQNMIGETVIPAHRTTPDSIELMELFAKMADEGVNTVVMEVSSHSLALERVAACEFDIGAYTNITQDHLDFHKTMENYIAAKAILFGMCKIGVLNRDDDSYEKMLAACSGETVCYGVDCADGVSASEIEYGMSGVEFTLSYKGKKEHISLAIPGRFSVYNALTAASCCIAAGVSLEKIAAGLRAAHGVKGRIEVVKTDTDYTVIIDYAHTPDGLLNILNTIRGFAKGRIVTLFGCGGDRDKTKRPKMGKIAGELSDFCIVTSDNPRTENPSAIIDDILVGISQTDCAYVVIENRFDAIEFALDNAKPNDIILLAGKGHETYQILKDRTIMFDEREIVMKLVDTSEM